MKNSQRGASNASIIAVIAVLALAIFLTARIGPVYYNRTALQESLDNFLSAEAMRMTDGELRDAVIGYAQQADITLTEDDISIERVTEGGNKIIITVNYTDEADLLVTMYQKPVEIVSSSPVWKIEDRVGDETNFQAQPGAAGRPSAPPGGNYANRARDAAKKIGR